MTTCPPFTRLTAILLLILSSHDSSGISPAQAQYIQGYERIINPNPSGGPQQQWFWRPEVTPAQIPYHILDLSPTVVFLEYNCYYMRDICKNAQNWFDTPRGQSRSPRNRFAYDLNTGKRKRNDKRRDKSCPSSWKNKHPCPETDQGIVMRHDGPWQHKALEPGTKVNEIKAKRDANGRITEKSQVRYTCDEFPPATWVEGGSGLNSTLIRAVDAETRCAAFRCGGTKGQNVKAEQNWQATAHGRLRAKLTSLVRERHDDFNHFPTFDPNDDVIFFFFRYRGNIRGNANGVAAKIYTYSDATLGQQQDPVVDVTQAKQRRGAGSGVAMGRAEYDRFLRWADTVTMEELVATRNGSVEEDVIYANETMDMSSVDMGDLGLGDRGIGAALRLEIREEIHAATRSSSRRRVVPVEEVYRDEADAVITPLLKKATKADIEAARLVVKNALRGSTTLSSDTKVTDEVASAAALVSEADLSEAISGRKIRVSSRKRHWMERTRHNDTNPQGKDQVFRNVIDFGAVGDGLTDDTHAIKRALSQGRKCAGPSAQNVIVYLPPGRYRVSSTIPLPIGTQLIGDAIERPVLVASCSFVGPGVLSVDGEKHRHVHRQIRNLRIDMTETDPLREVACVHYGADQIASIENVELVASGSSGTLNHGISAESGGGGVLTDVTFRGGRFGLYGVGEQGFTAQRLTFDGCDTGVQIALGPGSSLSWKSVTVRNASVGFRLSGDAEKGHTVVASALFIDSAFHNVSIAVLIPPLEKGARAIGVVLDNIRLEDVDRAVADSSGTTVLAAEERIFHWALGAVYPPDRASHESGMVAGYRRDRRLLDGDGAFFERPRPQYEGLSAEEVVRVKDLGVKGDGVTDDTASLQLALYESLGRVLIIDAGSYVLRDTVTIPLGSRIVGEAWPRFVAAGPYFSDARKLQAMIRVGNPGDVGRVEMQDLIFTTTGHPAGLTLVEWNVQAESPGSAGVWDCHLRVEGGGAASLMMHVTANASGHFENMRLSGAGETKDATAYVGRGMLIESTKPTWLYATSSENAVYYLYNFHGARSVFAGTLRAETASSWPASSEDLGTVSGDPDRNCTAGWAVMIRGCRDVAVAGARLSSSFSKQRRGLAVLDDNNANVRMQGLVAAGADVMAVVDGKSVEGSPGHSSHWSQLSVLDAPDCGTGQDEPDDYIWVDPDLWEMETPSFTCLPPSKVKLPPWTGATMTIDYPRLTITDGTWETTITKPPIVVTEWMFEPVTLYSQERRDIQGRQLGQAFSDFWPMLSGTPFWPAATYLNAKGELKSTTPDAAFPTVPPENGPGGGQAPGNLRGAWPRRQVRPMPGLGEIPLVGACQFNDFLCPNPWFRDDFWDDENMDPSPGRDDGEEQAEEVPCPDEPSSTTTSRRPPKPTPQPEPEPSPRASSDPRTNEVNCFHSGRKETRIRMANTINSFCNSLGEEGDVLGPRRKEPDGYPLPFSSGQFSTTKIYMRMVIKEGCEWRWNLAECQRYLNVPVDSCNCEGIDGKQGGTLSNNCMEWKIDPNAY